MGIFAHSVALKRSRVSFNRGMQASLSMPSRVRWSLPMILRKGCVPKRRDRKDSSCETFLTTGPRHGSSKGRRAAAPFRQKPLLAHRHADWNMPAGGCHGTLAPSSSLLVHSWPLLPAFPVFLGILPEARRVHAKTDKQKPELKFAIYSRGTLLLPLQLGDLIDLLLTCEVSLTS